MKISKLLLTLSRQDIKLWVEDGGLKFSAPEGRFTAELKQQVKANKAEIIAFLQQTSLSPSSAELPVVERTERMALSVNQQSIWAACQVQDNLSIYNVVSSAIMEEEVDAEVYSAALQRVISGHEVFQTRILQEAGVPYVQLVSDQKARLITKDFSSLSLEQADHAVKQVIDVEESHHFDFANEPLARFHLIKLPQQRSIVVFNIHHIICDAYSLGLLAESMATCYQAMRDQQPYEQPDYPRQYADFAQWQRDLVEQGKLDGQLTYWRDTLSGLAPLLEVETDFPRTSARSHHGKTLSGTISAPVAARLNEVARQHGVTFYSLMLGIYNILLSIYSGSRDIAVGTPVANRTHPQTQKLVGYFVNTIVMRNQVDPALSFADFIKSVKEQVFNGQANQDLPLVSLLQELDIETSNSFSPLYQFSFVFNNAEQVTKALAEENQQYTDNDGIVSHAAIDDLSLQIKDWVDGLNVKLTYKTDLFLPQTVERMIAHFIYLAECVAESADISVSSLLSGLPPVQRELLSDFSGVGAFEFSQQLIHQQFSEQSLRTPTQRAVEMGEQVLTYQQLEQRANQIAHWLREQGVRPEQGVGICAQRSVDVVAGFLGILKAGAVFIPVDPRLPAARKASIVAASGMQLLLVDQENSEDASTLGVHSQVLNSTLAADYADTVPTVPLSAHNAAYLLYTSGTTGKPKGITVSHTGIVNLAKSQAELFRLSTQSRVLQFASMGFDAWISEVCVTLYAGATLCLFPQDELMPSHALNQQLIDQAISHFTMPPSALAILPSEGMTGVTVVSAGETCSPEVADKWSEHNHFINAYGPSEATVCTSVYHYQYQQSEVSVSIGKPINNTSVYVLDEQGMQVPIGVRGELYIAGEGLARGYTDNPALSAEKFLPDPFSHLPGARMYRSGDIVRMRHDGNLEFLGRNDKQVNIRGFRIELDEITRTLQACEQVRDGVAVDVALASGDTAVVAYYVAQTDTNEDSTAIKLQLKQQLPNYMVPLAFVPLPELPLTINGKVDKSQLPLPEFSSQARNERAMSELEQQVADLCCEVMQLESIDPDQSFSELGGHSLMISLFTARLKEKMNVELPTRILFENDSVAQIAKLIDSGLYQRRSVRQPIVKASKSERTQLSLMQQRLWFVCRMNSDSPAYHIPVIIRLTGSLDKQALHDALLEIQGRHDVLRTTFVEMNGIPSQLVRKKAKLTLPLVSLSEQLQQAQDEQARMAICMAQVGEEIEKPFELLNKPLIRAALFELQEQDHILCVTLHHLISDGWSVGNFMNELNVLLQANKQQEAVQLPELTVQYSDFAAWQRNLIQDKVLDTQLSYWQEQLNGIPTLLALPSDKPRPAVQSHRGATHTVTLPKSLSNELKQWTQQHGVSMFMGLLGAFQLLLARYSGQQDIVVGSPVANRTHTEVEPLIGFFVNTIVLRNEIDEDSSVDAFIEQVKNTCIQAFSHQDLPFEMLVEHLNPERSPSHSPLFQVMFNQEDTINATPNDVGLAMQNVRSFNPTAKYDLNVAFSQQGDQIEFYWEYCVDLFDQETIEQMSRHYENLLIGFCQQSKTVLRDIALMADDETQQMLVDWNSNSLALPETPMIHHLFEQQAVTCPTAVALVTETQEFSYQALNQAANQLAHYLVEQGVAPTDRVAICLPRTSQLVIATLACLKAGATYVPIDPNYPAHRIEFMMTDSQASVLLTSEQHAHAHLPEVLTRVDLDTDWVAQQLARQSTENPALTTCLADQLAYIIYTSGSTGQPKGVCIAHRSAVAMLQWAQDYFSVAQLRRVLATTSVCFDLSIFEMFAPLSSGTTVVLRENILALVDDTQVDVSVINTVPSALEQLIALKALPASTELVLVAGEALKLSTVTAFYNAYPDLRLFNLYGPSEDTTYSTVAEVRPDDKYGVTIGKPINNTHAYVLDKYMRPTPAGVAGELYLAGAGVTQGYWQRAELTAQNFIPNPFASEQGDRLYRTSDIVTYTREGEIRYLGRDDRQIKIRGYRIEVGEVEHLILQHDSVSQAVVVAKSPTHSDDDTVAAQQGNTYLACYIVANSSSSAFCEQTLTEYLLQYLPEYFVPSVFVTLDSLPLTPNGKVDHRALPEPDMAKDVEQQEYVAAETQTEQALVTIWQSLLQKEQIGMVDNFFSLGGHSLLAMQLVSQVQQALSVRIPLNTLFNHPTIRALAQFIDQQDTDSAEIEALPQLTHDAKDKFEPFALTDVQHAYWLGRSVTMKMGNIGTHTYQEFDFDSLDVAQMQQDFNLLIQRHDMMRMIVNDQGQQQVLEHVDDYVLDYQDISLQSAEQQQAILLARRDEMSHHVFEPASWPLFDIRVIKISETQYRLYWSFDGLLFDGASHRILGRELLLLNQGRADQLQPLEVTFRDYVLAEEQLKDSQAYKQARDYWLARVPELPLAPGLPLAKDPEQVDKPVFNRRRFMLSGEQWTSLKELAATLNVTPTVLLVSAFSEIIILWSKQPRFSLNLTLFNRLAMHEQVNDIIGDFTSLTLLQVEHDSSQPFAQRCHTLQAQLWQDLEHRLFGGIEVQRALRSHYGTEASTEIPVIFTSLLGLSGDGQDDAKQAGKMSQGFGVSQTSQVWLDHQVGEIDGQLELNWDAVEELFPSGMLDEMFESYQGLIFGLVEQASLSQQNTVVELPEAQWARRQQVNATTGAESGLLMQQAFEQQVQQTPDAIAVIQQATTVSYQQLDNAANHLATQLQAHAKQSKPLIAIVMEKGWEQVVAVMAVLKAGYAYLPIDANNPTQRIEQLLELGDVEQLITQQQFSARLQQAKWANKYHCHSITEDLLSVSQMAKPTIETTPQSLAYVIFTSGSTGTPKGVVIDHRGAVNTIDSMNDDFAVTAQDKILGLSALNFDLSVYDIFGPLSVGGTLVLPAATLAKDTEHWHQQVLQHGVTLWNTVPALMQLYVDYVDTIGAPLPVSLRQVLMSGDWIPLSLPSRIKALSPTTQVCSLGGATEASIWSISYPIDEVAADWHSIPYGKPMRNQTFHVMRSDFSHCPDLVAGDLYIGGIGVAKGYWQDQEKTAASFLTHPETGEILYRTGDMGRYLTDGNIEFLGREDAQVKIAGYRIELGEVDAGIVRHPRVAQSLTLAVGEEQKSRRLVSYVVLNPLPTEPDTCPEMIQDPLERTLFKLKMPGLRTIEAAQAELALPEVSGTSVSLNWQDIAQAADDFDVMDMTQLSALLQCVKQHQVEGATLPKYFYPSTGSLNAVQLYLSLRDGAISGIAPGTYYYDPSKHALVQLSNVVTQAEDTPMSLHLVAETAAINPLYGTLGARLATVEAGYIQDLLVAAAASQQISLSAVQCTELKQVCQLNDSHQVMISLSGGYRRTNLDALTEQPRVVTASAPDSTNLAMPSVEVPTAIQLELLHRQSFRQFDEAQNVSLNALAQVVATLNAMPDAAQLSCYLYVKPNRVDGLDGGYYRYCQHSHTLAPVVGQNEDPHFRFLGVNEAIYLGAAFALFLIGEEQDLLNAGAVGQRLLSSCTTQSVGLCPIGKFEQHALSEVMALTEQRQVLHSFLGGHISKAQLSNWAQEQDQANSPQALLQTFLGQQVPEYMVPKTIMLIDQMPLTNNGKIDRKALPAPDFSEELNNNYVAPQSNTERVICGVWEDVLGMAQIGIHDSFFSIGGNSLTAMEIIGRMQEKTGVRVQLHLLFEQPTIHEIAALIDEQSKDAPEPEEVQQSWGELVHDAENHLAPFPLTHVQQAYWLGRSDAFELGNISCHSYSETDLNSYDHAEFEAGFNRLIQHHDMLRMVVTDDGQQRFVDHDCYYQVDYQDLSVVAEDEAQTRLMAQRERMSHQVHDTSRWPLFELAVFKVSEQQYRMFLSIDLLLVDGSSMGMLARDIAQLDQPLIKPAFTFRDYVIAEQQLQQTALYQDAQSYWHERIATMPNGPQLPLAVDPGQIDKPRFVRHEFTLPQTQWSQMKQRAQSKGITSAVLLASVFSEVLGYWSKHGQFCLNLTLFNRHPFDQDVFKLLGDFTSLILLEIDCVERLSFAQRCQIVQKRLAQDLEHRMYSGVEVLRKMQQQDSSVKMPVVFTSLLDVGGPKTEEETQDQADTSYGITQTSQVWLDHQVRERGGALHMNWDVVEGLFPEGMIEAMFECYQGLLMQLAENESQWSAPLSLLPEAQQQRREQVNATAQSLPGGLLHHGFEQQAARTPDAMALITSEHQISYRVLNASSNALAMQLMNDGVVPGDRVAVAMHKGWQQVVAVFAILKAGATYLPVDAQLPDSRIEQILTQAEARLVLTQPELISRPWVDNQATRAVDATLLNATAMSNPAPLQQETDLAYIIFTSGSTGTPKGVMIDHRGAVNTNGSINQMFDVSSTDRVLGLSSLSFDLSVYDIFGLLSTGGALVLPDAELAKDPAHWSQLMREHQVTVWNTVPALMQILVDYCEHTDPSAMAHVRQVMMSGDWIPLSLPDAIRSLNADTEVTSLGGATEASIWSIYYPVEQVAPQWKSIPYGKPLANQTYHVLKPDLRPCPDWVPGELYIGGIGVAQGYWRDQEKTDSHFIIHPDTQERLYRTGDFGRYFADGNIEFLGREDNQVKVQGYRIELGDLDAALSRHPMIANSVTLAHGQNQQNKQLVSYVVLDQPEADPADTVDTIQDPLERTLFKLKMAGLRTLAQDSVLVPLPLNGLVDLSAPVLKQSWANPVTGQDSASLTIEQLSVVLSGAKQYPVEGASGPKYFYPSTGSLNAVQLYLSVADGVIKGLEAGCYYYDPQGHQLAKLADGSALTEGQCELHLVVESEAIAPLYGRRADDLATVESGYLAALLSASMQAQGATLSPVGVREDLGSQLQLSDSCHCVMSMALDQTQVPCGSVQMDTQAASSTQVGLPEVSLPQSGTVSLLGRQSFRHFDDNIVIPLADLATVLATAAAANPDSQLGIYLFVKANRIDTLAQGYYRYCPKQHGLILLSDNEDPHFRYLGVNEQTYLHSAFAVYLVGDATAGRVAAGVVGQRIMTTCSEQMIGLCPIGFLNDQGLAESWSAEPAHSIVHSFLGGRLFPQQVQQWDQLDQDEQGLVGTLQTYLGQKLPEYMVPKVIMPLPQLPLTANGKIDRKALPVPDFSSLTMENHVAAQSVQEKALAEIWQDVLGISNPGIHDNFMAKGGNSLSIVQLQTRIRAQFKIALDLRQLYESQTIAEQARFIQASLQDSGQGGRDDILTVADIKAISLKQQLKQRIARLSDEQVTSLLNQQTDLEGV